MKHLTEAKITAERESVSEIESSPDKHVLRLMLAIRSALAARASQLSEELRRIQELLSLMCEAASTASSEDLLLRSSTLSEDTRAQLTSSFTLTAEEVERLRVLANPPGHSRPLWHPSRWVAAVYRLLLGRQYAFNKWMTEHHARLAQQTENIRLSMLQILALTARQTQCVVTFERQGFELLREIFDGIESALRVVWGVNEVQSHVPTTANESNSESLPSEELGDWRSDLHEIRDQVDALAQRLRLLEEKTGRLEVWDTTMAILSKRIDSFISDYEATLREMKDDIDTLKQWAEHVCHPPHGGLGGHAKEFVHERVMRAPHPLAPAFSFLEFERALRGGEYQIAQEQSRYVDWFVSQPAPILDVGCGRGEFLELLRQHGIEAMGIDRDADMVSYCQQKGLRVMQAELEDYLKSLPDESLGGVFLGQVIEHLEQRLVLELPTLLWNKLVPGGTVVIETVNPMCLSTFSGAMYADPTHVRPIHPKGLEFLLASVGFADTTLLFSAPVPEADKLQLIQEKAPLEPTTKDIVIQMNENLQRLNTLLYSYANYALAARKPQ